ncbi:MAG: hypothetical protein Q8O38_07005, partial [Sulfurimicrobium sp.]|nr:hypothetical protein [Sulfurimicrobium sp.]
ALFANRVAGLRNALRHRDSAVLEAQRHLSSRYRASGPTQGPQQHDLRKEPFYFYSGVALG